MSEPVIPERWSEARPLVVPMLRRVTEPAHAWYAELADPKNRVVRRPFAPFLHEILALDLHDQRVILNHGVVEAWGVALEVVFAAARENLAGRATHGLVRRAEYGGLWQIDAGDRLESSRLLLPGFLGAFADSVPGRPVAIVPGPRVLLVGGEGSADHLDTLIDLAARGFEFTSARPGGREAARSPLSPVLYTAARGADADGTTGSVVPWSPGPELAEAYGADVAMLGAWLAAHEFQRQREQLTDNPHVESAVAEVVVLEDRDPPATCAIWAESAGSTLLPATDLVRIVGGGPEFLVPWAAVWRDARGCLEPTRLDPTRYRARWPMPATLARLRGAAEPTVT